MESNPYIRNWHINFYDLSLYIVVKIDLFLCLSSSNWIKRNVSEVQYGNKILVWVIGIFPYATFWSPRMV